jgi:hypothetical protein
MRVLGIAAMGAVAVLIAACGGGGGGEALSAEEFRQQADAICKDYEGQINDLGSPNSLDELPAFVDKVIPIIEEGNAKLADLEPPDELAEDWDRAMELQNENLDVAHDLQDAIHDQDTARVQDDLTKLNATDQRSNEIARKIGLEDCGQSNT